MTLVNVVDLRSGDQFQFGSLWVEVVDEPLWTDVGVRLNLRDTADGVVMERWFPPADYIEIIPSSEEKDMNKNAQVTFAKGLIAGTVLKKKSNLTKAYIALAAAALYGIRAAREANRDLDDTVEKLRDERSRPVVVMEPVD